MVGVFRLLQRLERDRVLVLPFEPSRQRVHRCSLRAARAFDPEAIAGVHALGMGEPLTVAMVRNHSIPRVPDRDLFHRVHGPARVYGPAKAGPYRTAATVPAVVGSAFRRTVTDLRIAAAPEPPARDPSDYRASHRR